MKIYNPKKQRNVLTKVTVTLAAEISHMHLTQGIVISTGETVVVNNDEEVKTLIADGKLNKV